MATKVTRDSGKTRRDKNRAIRREELRLWLSNLGLEQQVLEIYNKLEDLDVEYDALQIQRLRASAEGKHKMVSKYLGDDKTLELSGDANNPVTVTTVDFKNA